jgi:DNA helicase TIP49 (TBP-interacting protein)
MKHIYKLSMLCIAMICLAATTYANSGDVLPQGYQSLRNKSVWELQKELDRELQVQENLLKQIEKLSVHAGTDTVLDRDLGHLTRLYRQRLKYTDELNKELTRKENLGNR